MGQILRISFKLNFVPNGLLWVEQELSQLGNLYTDVLTGNISLVLFIMKILKHTPGTYVR